MALPALAPLMLKVPAAIKAAMASKHFLSLLIASGFLGQTALSELGKAGERKTARKQIDLQRLLAEGQAEATKTSVLESRKQTKEYMEQLLKMKAVEKREAREAQTLERFTASQDRQMALIMQALQGMSQRPAGAPAEPGVGMLAMTRSNI
jgi:hypothetical protein